MKYVFTNRDATIAAVAAYLILPPLFAVGGFVLVNYFGKQICDYFNVTNFEGGRGFFMAFTVWPLSVIVSLIVGALFAAVIHLVAHRLASRLSGNSAEGSRA